MLNYLCSYYTLLCQCFSHKWIKFSTFLGGQTLNKLVHFRTSCTWTIIVILHAWCKFTDDSLHVPCTTCQISVYGPTLVNTDASLYWCLPSHVHQMCFLPFWRSVACACAFAKVQPATYSHLAI